MDNGADLTCTGESIRQKPSTTPLTSVFLGKYSNRLDIRRIYWKFGFAGEFLSQLLKQPVKLELAFVESEKDCAYNFV
ncbi:hypothetical protein PRIPAC_88160 [Pristionchus pacificus]|uniref:Uncharacterized protein n=1 Tax=Pristionchus pacificus TaxID=54126 RepID=A0A2A6B990_PRIPA|nr:hypothetical protein PRIPAC_88160 [Pristionchus pacificus]|eukprot:PDM62438.1 hypothetical protein PRIPAC_51880 [Pristionchus pacificus]